MGVPKKWLILVAMLLSLPALPTLPISAASAPAGFQIATLKTVKSVPSVSLENKITIVLTITDNSSVPVSSIEVYEYFNPSFTMVGNVKVTEPSGTSTVAVPQTTTVTQVQAIIDPPLPDSLNPGQSVTISYVELAAGPGDFQVPPALTWFTFSVGPTEIRSSVYSNGVVVHIPNQMEKVILLVYPYVMAATAFTVTLTILVWVRNRLSKVDAKKLSR